jgi:hypothetical protein
MVGGGKNDFGVFNILETVDLETRKSNCANFPALPSGGLAASGFFVDNDHPIVCGGWNLETGFVRYITIIFILFAQFGHLFLVSMLALL